MGTSEPMKEREMTPTQTSAIVQAAQAWAVAHDRRKAAGRIKRQVQAQARLYPLSLPGKWQASAALSEAKRMERAALQALHRACAPKAITLKADVREVIDLPQVENSP